MKIGLISDIHGNILALEKVFEEFDKLDVDKVLCAGDIIGLGPHPEEVVQYLKTKDNLISVRGNHEGYLLDGIPKIIHARPMNDVETNHHKWIHGKLTEDSKKFLSKLPKEQNLKIDDVNIYMTHYPISKFGIYKQFIKNPTLEENQNLFEEVDANVYIYGHTHIFSENKSNNKIYLNLDSVGCPVKTNYASAGILNINGKEVEFKPLKVEYDVEKVKREISELKYSFYQSVLDIFY